MTKFHVAVGDEFPLNEGGSDDRPGRGRHGRHRHPHHGHRGHFHGHHHRRHGFHVIAHLAKFAVLAGLVALLVAGKIPATAAYGMIAAGVAVMLVLAVVRIRHFRGRAQ